MFSAKSMHAYHRRTWLVGRRFMIFWFAGVGLITGSAALDAMWELGWGYDGQDVLVGLAMMALGIVFLLMWNVMFRVLRALNHLFYGPDPDEERRKSDPSGGS